MHSEGARGTDPERQRDGERETRGRRSATVGKRRSRGGRVKDKARIKWTGESILPPVRRPPEQSDRAAYLHTTASATTGTGAREGLGQDKCVDGQDGRKDS
ncbi:hypothetical protein NQZ68_016719 [Dissostichus eleginoides]|nr:hypothetical protein NQZ68_016719 [Dissostichus eleginoides]